MSQEMIVYLGREAIYTVLLISGPLLLVSIAVGLIISVFQATTQIQEQTLTFVPKIVSIFLLIIVLGPWMLNILVGFTMNLFSIITKLGR